MENRNSLQPIRTAAPADRLLGRVCSVGGRRYLDCGFDQLIAVSDADAARYADGAFVEVEIAAGATPWHDAVSQQQAVQQSFDQLIASIRERTTLEVGLAAADVERLRSELTSPAPSGRRFPGLRPGQQLPLHAQPEELHGRAPFPSAGGRADRSAMLGLHGLQPAENQCRRTGLSESGASCARRGRGRRMLRCLCQPGGRFRTVRHLRRKRRPDPQEVVPELRRAFPQRRDRRRLPPRHENPRRSSFRKPSTRNRAGSAIRSTP